MVGGALLNLGLETFRSYHYPTDLKSLFNMGFGKLNPISMVDTFSITGVSEATILANLPQLLVSMLYFRYNNLFTRMLCALEWSKISEKRAPLRVTSPQGRQRSTFFLQLPYRYSIPLWLISLLLHWLLSQSLFLASVDFTYHDIPVGTVEFPGTLANEEVSGYATIGYSCVAIICTLTFGSLVVLAIIALAFKAYPEGMPFVGNCSFAISAACHRSKDDPDAATKPIMWGCPINDVQDVFRDQVEHLGDEQIGHCCITSQAVMPPVPGNSMHKKKEFPVGKEYRRSRTSMSQARAL